MNIKTSVKKLLNDISSTQLIVAVSIFMMCTVNTSFFNHLTEIYPVSWTNAGFLFSVAWVFTGFIIIMLSLVCVEKTTKPLLIIVLLLASITAYFMDTYNTIIDETMIRNVAGTDLAESMDLFSLKLVVYFLLFGVVPSFLIIRAKVIHQPLLKQVISRIKLIMVALISIVVLLFLFSDFYSSFVREHKSIRYYSNPATIVYSSIKYVSSKFSSKDIGMENTGLDAKIPIEDNHRELVIFVVGETARADRFSLNGYEKETNPLLKKEKLVSFTNFWSCGTSTAVSVPCMFSIFSESDFDNEKAEHKENLLDVFAHAGVNVLWLENNSSSKGVADRIEHVDYKSRSNNAVCDVECRDVGMLMDLQAYIDKHDRGDIVIVLHQMGNHGPAYYKRYPKEFEQFTPVCKTNQLEECSSEEINNAYDNAILYTDYFLSEAISLLKKHKNEFETALLYVSDHGESLGENGLYLHGLPGFVAPESQRHVPAILWLGESYDDIDLNKIALNKEKKYSHDNVFHTMLSLLEIQSDIYDAKKDILHDGRI